MVHRFIALVHVVYDLAAAKTPHMTDNWLFLQHGRLLPDQENC
jgi:hypothetical protein